MEQTINRLDETVQCLNLRLIALRQERMVDEMEVMISSAMASQPPLEGASLMAHQAGRRGGMIGLAAGARP